MYEGSYSKEKFKPPPIPFSCCRTKTAITNEVYQERAKVNNLKKHEHGRLVRIKAEEKKFKKYFLKLFIPSRLFSKKYFFQSLFSFRVS